MNKIKITNRWTGSVLFEHEEENNTLKKTVEKAIEQEANLEGAYLRGANLRGANLRGVYIYVSDDEIDEPNIVESFEQKTNIKITEYYINRNIFPTTWNCFWKYGLIICDYEMAKPIKKIKTEEAEKELSEKYECEVKIED